MGTTARRIRTSTVLLTLPGANAVATHRTCSALSESGTEGIVSVVCTQAGSVQLEVAQGTLLADLMSTLTDVLAVLDIHFIVQAPEDYEDSPLVLTASGWMYQVICPDCGLYEANSYTARPYAYCDSCLDPQ